MKNILLSLLFIPLLSVAQTQPKPKTTPAKKPASSATAAKKPATTATKKPATTAATKPAVPAKPNPKVVTLTEQAYQLYNESKDLECEKIIKQILVLDPKNKDAFMLRANIAMFAFKYDDMWSNLDKVFNLYPSEPEVYSAFAMTHLNYYFLNDSTKRILCRKTIRLASRNAEGYAAMGMVAAVGGNYFEALDYFDISFNKVWKDTLSKVVLDLPYANCLYNTGDTLGAIAKLNRMIPRMSGKDKYTCVFLKVKYQLDINDINVASDLDTLNSYAPNQAEVLMLNAKYLSRTNRKDSACKTAKLVRYSEGGEAFDLSPYCDNLQKSIDLTKVKKLTYSMGMSDFILNVSEFAYPNIVRFSWTEGQTMDKSAWNKGTVSLAKRALDSAYMYVGSFDNNTDVTLDRTTSFWLSQLQWKDVKRDSTTRLNMNGTTLNGFKMVGHEQIEVFNAANKEILLDCLVLFDGTNKVCYLNDALNPLVIKFESEKFNFVLAKME
jgi:tetratricopeptide (TPR) repeat protein